MELNNASFAYLAGLIDSDGSVGLCHSGKVYVIPHMGVKNKNLEMLQRLKSSFGGKIGGPDGDWVYELQFHVKEIDFLLPKILPYLIRKF